MVLPLLRRNTLRLHELHDFTSRLVNKQLISAISDLPLVVVHEATSEDDDLVLVCACGVAAAPQQPVLVVVRSCELFIMPVRHHLSQISSSADRRVGDLLVDVEVLTADQVCPIVQSDQGRVLAWSRQPTGHLVLSQLDEERLTFLHALDVVLEAASQFLDKLVPRDVISRLSLE